MRFDPTRPLTTRDGRPVKKAFASEGGICGLVDTERRPNEPNSWDAKGRSSIKDRRLDLVDTRRAGARQAGPPRLSDAAMAAIERAAAAIGDERWLIMGRYNLFRTEVGTGDSVVCVCWTHRRSVVRGEAKGIEEDPLGQARLDHLAAAHPQAVLALIARCRAAEAALAESVAAVGPESKEGGDG